MTYFDWLRNKGCGCNNGCKDINPCSCDNILLEISNLHTDDQVLQDEIDDLSGKVETISGVVDTKLDESAITEYSTSQEVDDAINAAVSGRVDTSTFETFSGNVENEIDNLSEKVETVSGVVDTKLDASAYTPVDLTDYYTKEEVDDIADTKLDASAYTPTDLSNYYNKQEVNYIVESAITDVESEIPSLSGYATEQWVENKGYLTEHQPLKTINGNVISGTGDIVIEASGTSVTVDDHLDSASINPVQNKVIVGALNDKLDSSAYTPVDLTNYYTKQEVNSAITAVEGEIPVVPTSNSAFTNDEHFITSGDSVFNNYALTANTYTKQEVNNLVSNKIWCGTQQQYDQLPTKENDVLYLIHQ